MPQTNTHEEFSLDDPPPGGADISETAESLMSQMPEPTGLIADEQNSSGGESATDSAKVDKFGTVFNPEIHTGTMLKSGKWRERKKKDAVKDPRKKEVAVAATEGAAPVINEEELKIAADSAAASIFMMGMICGGEEWQPMGDDQKVEPINERALMTEAFKDYFRAKGITKLPPSTSLMLALGSYIVPRLFMPKTKARAKSVKTWFALRLTKWKLKREYKKRGINADVTIKDGEVLINGARPNTRNDGKRENDAREETSGAVHASG